MADSTLRLIHSQKIGVYSRHFQHSMPLSELHRLLYAEPESLRQNSTPMSPSSPSTCVGKSMMLSPEYWQIASLNTTLKKDSELRLGRDLHFFRGNCIIASYIGTEA